MKEGVWGECEVDSRTMPARSEDPGCVYCLASKMTAPALSYKQSPGSGATGDMSRQSIERGKQGRFGQKQIYLDQKILDLDFVLECLRTAL